MVKESSKISSFQKIKNELSWKLLIRPSHVKRPSGYIDIGDWWFDYIKVIKWQVYCFQTCEFKNALKRHVRRKVDHYNMTTTLLIEGRRGVDEAILHEYKIAILNSKKVACFVSQWMSPPKGSVSVCVSECVCVWVCACVCE